jgi:ABC-type cobalamin/Fe3+-siderophores transport system ATPase subunit
MASALEVRALAKSYRAGAGLCTATNRVLKAIDLTLHAGEAIGLIGDRGAGKSTLLLCLAGLLAPDAGAVRWFGDGSVAAAARHVLYHSAHTDLMRAGSVGCTHIHLVDLPAVAGLAWDLDGWIALRQLAGDVVVVAARSRAALAADLPLISLVNGRLHRAEECARVAEAVLATSS